jgi:hypothetical protein
MPDAPIDNRTLLRRTLVTMGAMVGACVLLVGTLTLIAVVVVGRAASHDAEAVSDTPSAQASPAAGVPAHKVK